MAMRTLTLDEVVAAARRLSPRDRLRLIERLAADLEPSVPAEPPAGESAETGEAEPAGTESVDTAPDVPIPRRSLYGLWADLAVELSEEEIRQLRREAWGGLGDREI